jgi:hypothetical protein
MLTRSFDTARINEVVNHPAVRPFVGAVSYGELDVAPVVAKTEDWFLMGDHGGFLLSWSAPGVREIHTFVLPEGRGRWAADARAEMLDYARANGTRTLWTKIDPVHRHTVQFARRGGMQPTEEMILMLGTPYQVYKMELR